MRDQYVESMFAYRVFDSDEGHRVPSMLKHSMIVWGDFLLQCGGFYLRRKSIHYQRWLMQSNIVYKNFVEDLKRSKD